ncbi:hypothetical protein V8C40DRAFT_280163 [Trichoderma camerunense]
MAKQIKNDERFKPAMMEFALWSSITGLDDLLELSITDILRLGDRRYCQERRAEAIMSAIGVKKWYEKERRRKTTQKRDLETNLILGKYPKSFISEVRERIPGTFFALFAKVPHADAHDRLQITAHESGLNGYPIMKLYEAHPTLPRPTLNGSLLPFSEIGHRYYRIPWSMNRSLEMKTHISVRSWKISTSGKVTIKQACVLSSSALNGIIKSPEVLPCFFWGFTYRTIGCPEGHMRRVDMHEWTAARKSEVHMVVVMHGPCQQPTMTQNPTSSWGAVFKVDENADKRMLSQKGHAIQGIVVRCMKKDTKRTAGEEESVGGTSQRLVKIGNFYASCPDEIVLPEVQNVSWKIL